MPLRFLLRILTASDESINPETTRAGSGRLTVLAIGNMLPQGAHATGSRAPFEWLNGPLLGMEVDG
jgi:hypothetical protein